MNDFLCTFVITYTLSYYGGGILAFVLVNVRISHRTDLPREAIRPVVPIASWGGSVPNIPKKPIATCDFPGLVQSPLPPPPPPSGSAHVFYVSYILFALIKLWNKTILTQKAFSTFLSSHTPYHTMEEWNPCLYLVNVRISHTTDLHWKAIGPFGPIASWWGSYMY